MMIESNENAQNDVPITFFLSERYFRGNCLGFWTRIPTQTPWNFKPDNLVDSESDNPLNFEYLIALKLEGCTRDDGK